jgi:RNA-binding protein
MTRDPHHAPLTGSQRRYLRSQAHHLQPVVQIGKTGLAPNVLAAVDRALEQHELIKVRFQDFKAQKRELSRAIAQASNSELIGAVGHVCLFYRRHPDPDKRKIHLPST